MQLNYAIILCKLCIIIEKKLKECPKDARRWEVSTMKLTKKNLRSSDAFKSDANIKKIAQFYLYLRFTCVIKVVKSKMPLLMPWLKYNGMPQL